MSGGFTFGQPSSSGQSSGGLFGTSGTNTSSGSGGGLFGGNTGSSGAFSFGQTSTTGSTENKAGGLFGGGAGGSTGGNIFSQPSGSSSTESKSLFGNASSSSQTPGTPAQAPAPKSLFGSTTPGASTGGLFGGTSSTTPAGQPPTSLFGASTGTASNQSSATTKPTFSFGNTATTSAPGSSAPAQGSTLFGQQSSQSSSKGGLFGQPGGSSQPTSGALFGQKPAAESSAPTSGSLFGQKPAEASSTPTSGGLFGQTPATGSSTPASGAAADQQTRTPASTQPSSSSTVFGGSSKPAESGNALSGGLFGAKPSQPASSAGFSFGAPKKDDKPAEAPTASKPFSFPTTSGPTATTSSPQPSSSIFTSTTTTSAPSSGGLFAKPAAPAGQSNEQPKPAGFSFTPASASTSQPAATSSAPFGGFKLPGSGSSSTTAASAAPMTTATTTAASSSAGLFSGLGGTTTSAPTATSAQPTTATAASSTAPALGTTLNLSASTTGPLAPAQSRLRNKTMDEILTRWASDLTRYTKDFRQHAETIAHWDQIIVDNSQKIDKLYVATRTCEKQTMSVEMQLAAVENQQNELEAWLTKYENDVDEMLAKEGANASELGGPDQERERTYKLAERLGERLDDMDRDLNSMIEEVNAANASLGQGGKADEPITQIVKILNSHLSQLQAIDQGTAALQAKVAAAQKAAQGMNYMNGGGLNGDNRNAVDSFYRSYMGRR